MKKDRRDYHRRRRLAGYKGPQERRRDAFIAEFWHQQDGKCYLCERSVALASAVLDHDHRCCPPSSFCPACVRGAVHYGCNSAIGIASDDPDLLETWARNLRHVMTKVGPQISGRDRQLSFIEGLETWPR